MHACSLSCFSCVRVFATPWAVARQAALSMEFSRQEYWSGLPYTPPGDLPNPGIKPTSLTSPALAGGLSTTCATWAVVGRVNSLMRIVPCLRSWWLSVKKNLPNNAGDVGSIPGSRRSPGGGNDNGLQYSWLQNPMVRGAWQATVRGMAKESDTASD